MTEIPEAFVQKIDRQILKFIIETLPEEQKNQLTPKLEAYAESFEEKDNPQKSEYIRSYLTK